MADTPDPLAHVPDPAERIQVFGYLSGSVPFVEILDQVTQQGVTINGFRALQVAAEINQQFVHAMEQLVARHLPEDEDHALSDDERWFRGLWNADSE